MTSVPPADNLAPPSMKWGRWVTSLLSRTVQRVNNLETGLSNNRSTFSGTISSVQAAIAGVTQQVSDFIANATFDASQVVSGTITRPVNTPGDITGATVTSTGVVSGASIISTGPITAVGNLTAGNVIATDGTFLGTITAAALSIAQGIFPSGVRSIGARNNIVTTDYAGAWIDADGNFGISPSSRAMKKDIEDWDGTDIQHLLDLQAVMFRYKSQPEADKKQIGLIAEDVVSAGFPEFVFYDRDGVLQGINYDRITVALIELAKYQEARIAKLERAIL